MNDTKPLLLRVPEVAKELNIGISSAWELVSTGQLPAVRIGRSVRVSRASLTDWISSPEATYALRRRKRR